MINHISISNYAIIENTEIDFGDGLNIITGETGSGKSIVIEAVSLALGSRADSAFVRHGMVFDEIDAGISGITASIVGRKPKEISENHQIICITHLPQIAACGDTHYRIFKEENDSSTFTTVEQLTGENIVDEIARLLGGENITETTRKSAKELLALTKQKSQ